MQCVTYLGLESNQCYEWQCYQQNKTFVFLFQLVTRYLVRGSLQSSSFITVGWAFLKRESVTFPSYIREKFLLS